MCLLVLRFLRRWGQEKIVADPLVEAVDSLASIDRDAVEWDALDGLLGSAIIWTLDRRGFERVVVQERLQCVSTLHSRYPEHSVLTRL